MRMMRFCAIFLALSLVGGCDDPPAPEKKTNESMAVGRPRIALVMKTLTNPFFVEMERGARRAEGKFGIELVVKTAAQETSIEQQIAIVADLITQKVSAVVIAPGDSVKLIPILKQATDAGIKVINIDNRLDPEYSRKLGLEGVPFISVDNEEGAYLAAKELVKDVTAPMQAAVIEGIRGAANAQARKLGAQRGFAQSPAVSLVASETANWKIDEAYDVTRKIMTTNPDVKLIFCANDMMALGAVRLLREKGLLGTVKVGGFDALAEAVQAVKAGEMAVTIDQQADRQGFMGVEAAVLAIGGKTPPLETMVDVKVITAAAISR
jgi:ribose transport system substrate-binding protein